VPLLVEVWNVKVIGSGGPADRHGSHADVRQPLQVLRHNSWTGVVRHRGGGLTVESQSKVPKVEPAGSLTVTNCTSTFAATLARPPANGFTLLVPPRDLRLGSARHGSAEGNRVTVFVAPAIIDVEAVTLTDPPLEAMVDRTLSAACTCAAVGVEWASRPWSGSGKVIGFWERKI